MTDDNFFDISELIDDYYSDSLSLIEGMESILLKIDKEFSENSDIILEIKNILGPLHTLKGNSGMLGFMLTQNYVHAIEGIIKKFLDDPKEEYRKNLINLILNSIVVLRKSLNSIVNTKKEPEDLESRLKEIEEINNNLDKLKEKKESKVLEDEDEKDFLFQKDSQLIKVDFSKLDKQINLLGELLINMTLLDQIENALTEKYPNDKDIKELSNIAQIMNKKVTELQEAVMAIRLLPLRKVFSLLPRIVRDISKELGKEIDIVIKGEETELDKTVIDQLGEPLLHIIRNSIDHGIETPEEREKKGKSRRGKITVSARQESNLIIIEIEDDGRGIDRKKVFEKAAKKGIVSKGTRLSKNEIYDLIFSPGFSTKDEISTTSGRGIGLDVVKSVINSLNGSISVESIEGYNTKFTIKLPLTLAIVKTLMVNVKNEIYAIPTGLIIESLKIRKEELKNIRGRDVYILREKIIPVFFLHDLVELEITDQSDFYLVIVEKNGIKLGIIVDSLIGQQEIVIKKMDEMVNNELIVGATILGNGEVVLILDVSYIFQEGNVTGDLDVQGIL